MMQDAADEVRKLYGQAGLTVDTAAVMPDHIGVELNFLAILLQKNHEESDRKGDYLRITEKLLNEHLLKWTPDFTRDMENAAEIPFYRELARTTRQVINIIGT
jgi:putative dimethyl sulfoxide reductase chaperone